MVRSYLPRPFSAIDGTRPQAEHQLWVLFPELSISKPSQGKNVQITLFQENFSRLCPAPCTPSKGQFAFLFRQAAVLVPSRQTSIPFLRSGACYRHQKEVTMAAPTQGDSKSMLNRPAAREGSDRCPWS